MDALKTVKTVKTGTGPVYERSARMAIRGTPHKVTQRGINAPDMFFPTESEDMKTGPVPIFPWLLSQFISSLLARTPLRPDGLALLLSAKYLLLSQRSARHTVRDLHHSEHVVWSVFRT